ncbi:response regulator [Chitinophaga sp. SYP-B3965]|uniref:response regulator n=1 Tax=Chitinophaga sp. SYP-B3965 TaxID=2663120 RepID=UPI001299AA2C|nr:response regulator [Chitinophaga sp. SYP-B3965]MRG47172.1 response regulator [Chitinophaga sp. SYP-B3965]
MKSTFQRNLVIGFGFSLVLLIFTSVASYISIRNLIFSADMVDHTNQVLHELEASISGMKDAETAQRGFLITNNADFLAPYNGAEDSIRKNIRNFQDLTVDNPLQQADAKHLLEVSGQRMAVLKANIDKSKRGEDVTVADMERGKLFMDRARELVAVMKDRETKLLAVRTAKLNEFAASTPTFIIIAALLALLITVISFLRVNADFRRRLEMQLALEVKDADIDRRIRIIQGVAGRVSDGDYEVRVADEGQDGLGILSVSLNKMAGSLKFSFDQLKDKEWLQTGIATLNDKMLGEYDVRVLAGQIVDHLTAYTESHIAGFYVAENDSTLRFIKGFAFDGEGSEYISYGKGLAGQAAESKRILHLKEVREDLLILHHVSGAIKPANIIAVPMFHERKVVGVVELAAAHPYPQRVLEFLEAASHSIGTVLFSVEGRKRLQELLEETQSQAEELQAQHNELENINSELELQAEKLQASEEELRVQQEELVQTNEELEERNQLIIERNRDIQQKVSELALSSKYKSEFLANMSHELRTPLNSILLLSRLMGENNKENLTEEQLEYAQVIQNSGKGLLSLIDEILDLSRIEAGKMDLSFSEVNLREIAQEMNALFGPVAKEKGLSFEVHTDGRMPAMIETDRQRLEQIIRNLLSNALKFTTEGTVSLNIAEDEKDHGIVVFTVKDTGIGISKDKQQVIFEAFQQEDGSTRRKFGGTGLGLSISKELVKLLGGNIHVRSEQGAGSEFEVRIPVTPSVIQDTPLLPKREPRFVSAVIPEHVPDDRNDVNPGDPVILIIEDDRTFAQYLLDFTRQKGYKGIVTVRGDEALSLTLQYQPKGILLDIQLPVKDGWEVMEELKNNNVTRHIPVHIMSSYEARFKSLSKGAVDFIDKPVSYGKMDDVFAKIEQILSSNSRKVLIVEENIKHAKALAYYLENFSVHTQIRNNITDSIDSLQKKEVNCVILDMGAAGEQSYDMLDEVKKHPGLENVPIIIFTGKNISGEEEQRIKQYADSIVVKVANSYQRIMDEVSLFLHLMQAKKEGERNGNGLGMLHDVLKDKTVLLADDDVRNIFALTKALETYNMRVISAMDGKEALKQLKKNPQVDIVLMDMMMPEMDGYESTRQIKADPQFKKLPVIAVTAKAMKGDREKCISAGASDYISKPVDIDQLISLLRVWLYDSNK